MKMPRRMEGTMLAACGVNCAACMAHLREKNRCGGCQGPDGQKRGKSCINCAKKRCANEKGHTWCFECASFPCARIKALDKTYRTRYGIGLVQNGRDAAALGMEAFMAAQRALFLCGCGGVVNQHQGVCSACGAPWCGNVPEDKPGRNNI